MLILFTFFLLEGSHQTHRHCKLCCQFIHDIAIGILYWFNISFCIFDILQCGFDTPQSCIYRLQGLHHKVITLFDDYWVYLILFMNYSYSYGSIPSFYIIFIILFFYDIIFNQYHEKFCTFSWSYCSHLEFSPSMKL